jgi:cytochrome c553
MKTVGLKGNTVARRKGLRRPGTGKPGTALLAILGLAVFSFSPLPIEVPGFGSGQAHGAPVQPGGVAGCVPCHGTDGIARDVEVPHLAGQNDVYLFNQLKAFKSGARKHPEMNCMSQRLSERDLRQLAEYFSNLPPR